MRLKSIKFTDHPGDEHEWQLDPFVLGDITLTVGVNASGKSRALAAIANLAWLISAKSKLGFRTSDSDCEAIFDSNGIEVRYVLRTRQGKIIEEIFSEGDQRRMARGPGGKGHIDVVKEQKTSQEFQTPDVDLAVVARRDSIQHPFFDPLHEWAESVYRYEFATPLGKNMVVVEMPALKTEVDPRNQQQVINIFSAGEANYKEPFKEAIKADMQKLNFPLDGLGTTVPTLIPTSSFPAPARYLYVKESDLPSITEQWEMSQGMFRALSVIIQLTYSQMAPVGQKPGCIIIDDIGEGLDFGRSCAMIELLMEKAKSAGVQLIMSTNDRFVMNKVPLEAWTVLRREKGRSRVYNYSNSRNIFDDFSYTGLNNFDFLATDFLAESLNGSAGAEHLSDEKTCDIR